MPCSSGCLTQDHSSWGECIRAKRQMVGWSRETAGFDRGAERRNEVECERYHRARVAGVQPDGTTERKVNFAMAQSEKYGARYGEDFHVVPRQDRRGYDPVFKKDIQAAQDSVMTDDLRTIMDTAKKVRPGAGII